MNILDFVIIITFTLALTKGYKLGLIKSGLKFFGLVISLVIALYIVTLIQELLNKNNLSNNVVFFSVASVLLTFLISSILQTFLGIIINVIPFTLPLIINNLFGSVFGILRWMLFMGLIFLVLGPDGLKIGQNYFRESLLFEYMFRLNTHLLAVLSKVFLNLDNLLGTEGKIV